MLQPARCCTCNLHVVAGIYKQPTMKHSSPQDFASLSHYVDAPKPTAEQFNEYFAIQKSSTFVIMQQKDYFHLHHNQPAGFTTLCPTVALCFSKYDHSADKQAGPAKKKPKHHA
jgi:hypothetical protein